MYMQTYTHIHTQTITIPGTTSTVQFIFIDTSILRDHVFGASQASKQWAWITKTLQQSTADWIIMAGHHPGTRTHGSERECRG